MIVDWLREYWLSAGVVWLMLAVVLVTLFSAWIDAGRVGLRGVTDDELDRIFGERLDKDDTRNPAA